MAVSRVAPIADDIRHAGVASVANVVELVDDWRGCREVLHDG
jgi:hypothetical protein